jgi:hypothetical protein
MILKFVFTAEGGVKNAGGETVLFEKGCDVENAQRRVRFHNTLFLRVFFKKIAVG